MGSISVDWPKVSVTARHKGCPIRNKSKVMTLVHNLANTIELFVCGGDAALRQIILSTYYIELSTR